jgi:DNA-binding transcriptional regulator YiaG
LFLLREVNHEELIDVQAALSGAAKAGTSRRRIATSGLADVFGVEMADAGDTAQERVPLLPKRKPAASKSRKKTPEVSDFPEPLTGNAISAWRSSLGETQYVFAERIRVTASTVSNWEKKDAASFGVQVRTLSALRKAWLKTHP